MSKVKIAELKNEDVRSIQDFKNYFIREGFKYVLNQEGDIKHHMSVYFKFIFEHQNFIRGKLDKLEICGIIKQFIEIKLNKNK